MPTATLQPYTNDAECVAALTQGRADAYVIDQSILISDAIGNPAVKVVGEPFTVDPYGIGVTKDDPSAKAVRQRLAQDHRGRRLLGRPVEGHHRHRRRRRRTRAAADRFGPGS